MRIDGKVINNRIYSYDFLRIIATVIIVFHHYQHASDFPINVYFDFWNGKFYFGYVVEFFFMLSGIMVAQNIEKIKSGGGNFKAFYLKKVIRLLPLVAVSAIVYELLLYIYQKLFYAQFMGVDITIFGILINSLGIQDGWVFKNPCVNNPTWYISVLLLCYVWFYFLTYTAGEKKIPEEYFYIGMIFLGIGAITYNIELPFLTRTSSRGYYSFFAGVLYARCIENKLSKKGALLSIGLIFILTWCFSNNYIDNGVNYILTFIYYPAVIYIFSFESVRELFKNNKWGELGKITFNVYIWHAGMLIAMYIIPKVLRIGVNLRTYKAMIIFTLLAFLIGLISHVLIEKPLFNWFSKKIM